MNTTRWMAAVIAGAAIAFAAGGARAEEKPYPMIKSVPKAPPQRTFATPEEAAKALVEAVKAGDAKALIEIVGPQSKSWIFSGDKVKDAEDWKRFAANYEEKNAIVKDGDAKAILNVGKDDFPFAAPIVKRGDKWAFDAEAGREEAINRRVGRNELDTIQAMLALVDAQRDYAMMDADGNRLPDYAARFISSKDKKDGLYWPTREGEPQSPLGPLVVKAVSEGYGGKAGTGKPEPFHGYFFRMLKAQGANAPGGKYDYEVKGRLVGGFAAVAWPAKYGVSGVMTFIVNHDGVVYEKDLGPNTESVAKKLTRFDPDKNWKKVQ